MKIWVDILTPKQLVFFEPLIKKLNKKHQVLCTSRDYSQVTNLAKLRKLKIVVVGKHGGLKKENKLLANLERMNLLFPIIQKFNPELTISFCSPDASRISFGLGIKHVGFSDSPHATAVMKLSIPLLQKLFIPWIIPKKEFVKYGIDKKNIISYKAIDAAITLERKSKNQKISLKKNNKKNILIRMEESEASYYSKSQKSILVIEKIIEQFKEENIIILGRYSDQIIELKKLFGNKIHILNMFYDGKYLLEKSDVFIGSGGTMTAESALLGIPTISLNSSPNIIENYLVKTKIITRESNPNKIVKIIKKIFEKPDLQSKIKAKKLLDSMENPHQKLIKIFNL